MEMLINPGLRGREHKARWGGIDRVASPVVVAASHLTAQRRVTSITAILSAVDFELQAYS